MEKLMRAPGPDGDIIGAEDKYEAGLVTRPQAEDQSHVAGRYRMECVRDGKVIWEEEFDNLFTDLGRRSILDVYLDRATAMTSIFMGLKGAGTPVSADTMASHGSWTEILAAVVANRLAPTFSAATGTTTATKTTPTAVSFPIVTAVSVVIAGCFIVMSGTNAPANTTGTLLSVGDFSSSRTVNSGDTLNVTYTANLT